MNKLDVTRSRAQPISGTGLAASVPLIRVSWDASPDLEQFLSFISAYAKGRFSNSLAERITLASTELLDNAVRYGSLARDFTYELAVDGSRVLVSAQNTTVPARIHMLTAQLHRLESTPDRVYAQELERSMGVGAGAGRRSMLGLARIRHEAEMRIEVEVDHTHVTVRAFCAR